MGGERHCESEVSFPRTQQCEHAWGSMRGGGARWHGFIKGSCSHPEFEAALYQPNVLKYELDIKLFNWGQI